MTDRSTGDHLWEPGHVCDTLCEFHLQLFEAESDILDRIDEMAQAALDRLDAMHHAAAVRERVHHLRWLLDLPANFFGRSPQEQQRALHDQWRLRGAAGAVPGQSQHSMGLALDLPKEVFDSYLYRGPYLPPIQDGKIVLPVVDS